MDQLLVVTEASEGAQQIQLISSTNTLKMISLFGNRASLQEQVNGVLGQSPSLCKLTLYKQVVGFGTAIEL